MSKNIDSCEYCGGRDFVIGKTKEGLRITANVVRNYWPRMVVQNVTDYTYSRKRPAKGPGPDSTTVTGKIFSDYKNVPYETLTEIFIYRNNRTAAKWKKMGLCEELKGTMIHALCSEELTVVVDFPVSIEMCSMITDINNVVKKENKRQIIKDVVDCYFDNAHMRDPYDVDSAIFNDRDTLVDNLLEVVDVKECKK
jgi:hypothetical protein